MNSLTIQELAETGQSTVRGTSFTAYALSPVKWLAEIVDAARNRHFFAQFAFQVVAPDGTKDIVFPKRTVYLGRSGMTYDTTERTAADVSWTTYNNVDGVTATPAISLSGVAITNHALRTNAMNLLDRAKEDLVYAIGDTVDYAVSTALVGATAATSSARGYQTVYGGDARADSELAAGDTLTTDMIAAARMKLMSTTCKYWTPSSPAAEASSSATKNPWYPDDAEPFVCFIPPEMEKILLTDSQFVNAAEYGSDKVVHSGEIGEYLRAKIIVTNNVLAYAASVTGPDASTTAVAMYRCLMIKARKSVGLAWGIEPKLTIFDFPSRAEQRILLETAYQAKVIYDDAIVAIDVSQS